jgi:hypothetical protein
VSLAKTRFRAKLSAPAPGLPSKIEGMAMVDDRTIVAGNDHEFAFGGCDAAHQAVLVNRPSELLFFRFSGPVLAR